MLEFTSFLQSTGQHSLELLWFPLLVWSVFAVLLQVALSRMESKDPLYHYYLRVALVASLPMGIIAAGLSSNIQYLSSSTAGGGASLIVIQNPITISVISGNAAPVNWGDPYLWIGVLTLILLTGGIARLAQMGWNYHRISQYAARLQTATLGTKSLVSSDNIELSPAAIDKTYIAYSGEVEIPFTFGWRRPVIVLPDHLKVDHEKLRMAVYHELMHIKRGDFLINGFIMAIKSLLWFHPLLHLLFDQTRAYREISCDSDVLNDKSISRKKYAELLFELAPKNETYTRQLVSMSVNQSTLQKRIKIMKTFTQPQRPFTKSILVSLVVLLGISGIIACSDLQSDGLTNSELQQTQQQLQQMEEQSVPLFVIREDTDLDGTFDSEEIATAKEANQISLVKSKYIRSIEVFKRDEVPAKYASKAQNGIAFVNLIDKEKAFTDLRDPGEGTRVQQQQEKDFFVVVEQMPKLKGGLNAIMECVKYPEEARKAGIEGRVIVRFIVNEQGVVEDPTAIKGIGGGADQEAIRCVKQAEFEPGIQRGKPVPVHYALPVVFKLPNTGSASSNSG